MVHVMWDTFLVTYRQNDIWMNEVRTYREPTVDGTSFRKDPDYTRGLLDDDSVDYTKVAKELVTEQIDEFRVHQ